MKRRHKRLAAVLAVMTGLTIATGLVFNALQDTMVFFVTPSEVMTRTEMPERNFRIGGLVKDGSVKRDPTSTRVVFQVTDTKESVPVTYEGILPDLFREGQGVVAEGRIDGNGVFHAHRVLARHDEEYMPAEAQAAIERAEHPSEADQEY